VTDETNTASEAEAHEAARYSRSDRISATIARLANHGTATHNALADTVNQSFNSQQPLKYDSYSKTFSVNGNTVSESDMETLINQGEVPHIYDDGRVTSFDRAHLLGIVSELKGRLDAHDGFDNSGAPRYRLTGDERTRVIAYHDAKATEIAYALQELDALDAQRARGAQIAAAMARADEAREERIDLYTAEAIERQEAEARARTILAARKKLIM
jgi:hypothetical protein